MIPVLPQEVNLKILNLLSDRNVLNASQVNKATNALVKDKPEVLLSKFACEIIKKRNENSSSYIDDANAYKVMLHDKFKHKDMKTLENNHKFDKAKGNAPERIAAYKRTDLLMKAMTGIALFNLISWSITTPSDQSNFVQSSGLMASLLTLGVSAWYFSSKPNYIKG